MKSQTKEALEMSIRYIQDMVKGEVSFNGVSNNQVIDACKEALQSEASELVSNDIHNVALKHQQKEYENFVVGITQSEASEQEHNFCSRCGKRASKDPSHIHTCTPPQVLDSKSEASAQPAQMYEMQKDGTLKALNVFESSWQGLTVDDLLKFNDDFGVSRECMLAIEQALKEKNER